MIESPMPACHQIKISPAYFEQVSNGNKTFEIRRDDRGYQKGDIVVMREYDHGNSFSVESQKYTGRAVSAHIGYVTAFEQQPGYVVFSLLNPEPYAGE